MIAAFEHYSEEPYTNFKTILNDAWKYMFHNFVQCKWDRVLVDITSYCSTHEMGCGYINVLYRIMFEQDQYQQFLDDFKVRINSFPTTHEEIVENVQAAAFDLGTILRIILQFYV